MQSKQTTGHVAEMVWVPLLHAFAGQTMIPVHDDALTGERRFQPGTRNSNGRTSEILLPSANRCIPRSTIPGHVSYKLQGRVLSARILPCKTREPLQVQRRLPGVVSYCQESKGGKHEATDPYSLTVIQFRSSPADRNQGHVTPHQSQRKASRGRLRQKMCFSFRAVSSAASNRRVLRCKYDHASNHTSALHLEPSNTL